MINHTPQKRALIIGGSSGIGLSVVKKLAKHGYELVVIHRDRRQYAEQFQQTISSLENKYAIKIITKNIDGLKKSVIQELLKKMSLENNHAFCTVLHAISKGNLKSFLTKNDQEGLTMEDISLTIDAMGTNIYLWLSELLKYRLIDSGSHIVTLTSMGNKKIWDGYGAVALAKSSLETMTKYLAVELASLKIRINTIQAGIINTPSLQLIPNAKYLIKEATNKNPLGRMTTSEDIANVVYLLGLPEARWINGSIMIVDGGEHLVL